MTTIDDDIPDVDDRDPPYPHYFYGTSALFDLPFGRCNQLRRDGDLLGAGIGRRHSRATPTAKPISTQWCSSTAESWCSTRLCLRRGRQMFASRFERVPVSENDASAALRPRLKPSRYLFRVRSRRLIGLKFQRRDRIRSRHSSSTSTPAMSPSISAQ